MREAHPDRSGETIQADPPRDAAPGRLRAFARSVAVSLLARFSGAGTEAAEVPDVPRPGGDPAVRVARVTTVIAGVGVSRNTGDPDMAEPR